MKNPNKMKILLTLSLLLSQFTYSQKLELEFGKISREEIEMKSYEKDKEAKAVILYDKGNSVFFETENGYDIRFTRHKRIKIFDKSESQFTEVSIPYYVDGYGKTEAVKSIEAFTYNITDGKLSQKKLDPSTVYEERINEQWYNKKFVFPDVQDGAILEYRYVLETPFHFNLPDWTFQDKIPTVYSEYQVSMIPFYEYVFLVQGTSKFDYQNSTVAEEKRTWGNVSMSYGQNVGSGIIFQDYVHTYVLKDIPAFIDESYITSINDYIIKMDFQLAKFNSPRGGTADIISTWTALNESLLKHEKFGKYLKNSSKIAKKILSENLNLGSKDNKQKEKEIIDYVKSNFEWNGYYSKYASQSAKDFFNKKKGNAADINLFMIALLNEAEINTKPLILSTRNHGKIPSDYPFDHFTNYVIALIDTDSPFLADGTEELLPYNKLPIRCINEKGLVVEKKEVPIWIDLSNKTLSTEKSTIRMRLEETSNNILAHVYIQDTEYEALSMRNKFKNDSLKIKEFFTDKVGEIEKLQTIGYESTNRPYSINFETKYETEKLGNNIVIKPFLNLPLSKNNLTQKKRTYPVDFIYPWENTFETIMEIPSEFLVSELPKGYNIENELVEISLYYSLNDSILTIKGNYKFKKSTYVTDEYSKIKYYLDQIVKDFNQPFVLEKRAKHNQQ
ncbi:MAG: transglutaminase domain-containing protein [Bacteroidales bacterium]